MMKDAKLSKAKSSKVNNFVHMKVVEEEPKPDIVKEKKEVKRSKSWGRRSTRTKKSISYR